jgi:hypothetical protein
MGFSLDWNAMKHFFCMLALALGAGAAQAQVQFESGSARPVNPGAADRAIAAQQRARAPARLDTKVVRCRDGSRHTLRACKRHGGVARR